MLHKIKAVTYDSKFKRPERARRTFKYPTHLFVHTIMKFLFVTLSDLRKGSSSNYVHVNILFCFLKNNSSDLDVKVILDKGV